MSLKSAVKRARKTKPAASADRRLQAAIKWLNGIAAKDTPDGVHARILVTEIENLLCKLADNAIFTSEILTSVAEAKKRGIIE